MAKTALNRPVLYLFKSLKPIAPYQYTRLRRLVSGHARDVDQLVTRNLPAIQAAAKASRRKLFVDCGVNEGVVLQRYAAALPDYDLEGFEIRAELIAIARRRNPAATIHHLAVSDRCAHLDAFLPRKFGTNFRGGASVLAHKITPDDLAERRIVESIDFVAWLRERRTREAYDHIVVKMDIEGAEYQVIDALHRDFMQTGERLIDYLMIKYHPEVLPFEGKQVRYPALLADMGIPVSHSI